MTPATILVVDDDDELRETLAEALAGLGYAALAAPSAEAALEALDREPPDLVLTDVRMTGQSGVDLCARIKRDPRLALLRVKALLDQLERAETIIATLGLAIEARDPYTAHHCERLSRYSATPGQGLGVDADMLRALRLGAVLHDLGKITVPDAVLLKPGPLDPDERRLIQEHSAAGADLLSGMKTLDAARPIVRHHHERFDGSGYPDGLKGEQIPLAARIMSAVDVYDALRTARPYKSPMSREKALGIFQSEAARGWWDPRVTETLVRLAPDLDAMTGAAAG